MATEDNYQLRSIPTKQLGWDYTTWTKTKLKAILDHYSTAYAADSTKIDLYEDLYDLTRHVSASLGRSMDADDRKRILHQYGLGDPARFDPHIAEFIRYFWNFGSHNGKIYDFPRTFPYVNAIFKLSPIAKDAIPRSQFNAIRDDIKIYMDAYRGKKIKNLGNDNEFKSLYNKITRPQKSYTAEERDQFMRWALPYFRDRLYAGQKPMELAVDENTDSRDKGSSEDESGKNADSEVLVRRENLEEEVVPAAISNIVDLEDSEEDDRSRSKSLEVDGVSFNRKRKRSSSSGDEMIHQTATTILNMAPADHGLQELSVAANPSGPNMENGPQTTMDILQQLRQEVSIIASATTNIATALSRIVDAHSGNSASDPLGRA